MAWTLGVYCLILIAASLLGGWIPLILKLTHQRMQIAISFIAGTMFGVSLLHMLPHAMENTPPREAMLSLIGGFLVMFFIERFFCFHHHDPPQDHPAPPHENTHRHEHHHEHHHDEKTHHPHTLTWSGAAAGMTLHSLIGGIALASAMAINLHNPDSPHLHWPGLATFFVIVLHKPLDALTVLTLAQLGNLSKNKSHLINALFSLAVPLGAGLFYLGLADVIQASPLFVGHALAFSAGTFLCVSLSDLLPELQFHDHDRVRLSAALLLGLLVAWGLGLLEHHNEHLHERPVTPIAQVLPRSVSPSSAESGSKLPGHVPDSGMKRLMKELFHDKRCLNV